MAQTSVQLDIDYVLRQMDDLGKSQKESALMGDVNLALEFTVRIGDLMNAVGGENAPEEIKNKFASIMNEPVVITPELERILNGKAEEKYLVPAPEQPTIQETLQPKKRVVLPLDPTALTEKEKEYEYTLDPKARRRLGSTLSGSGADSHLRVFMQYKDKDGKVQEWNPFKPWKCDIPFPIGVLKIFQGAREMPDFKSIATWRIIGIRFEGKSALAEAIATRYLQNGASVFDLYAANDNESLAWLEGPYADRVVLVHGDETTLECDFPTMAISDIDPTTAPYGRIYIVGKLFFANEELYYTALERLTSKFNQKDEWTRTNVILIREAQEWITGRMKSGETRNARDSAEEFTRFHNSLYHHGSAVIIDSQRDVGVTKDVRELTSWLCMKAMGNMDIPRKVSWTMRYVQPALLRLMPKHMFGFIGEKGQFSIWWFMLPPWHLSRGKSIIKRLHIVPIFDQEKVKNLMESMRAEEGRGGRKTVDTGTHETIVSDHLGEGTVETPSGKALSTIAEEMDLNYGTVKLQWKKHKMGTCGCSLLEEEK